MSDLEGSNPDSGIHVSDEQMSHPFLKKESDFFVKHILPVLLITSSVVYACPKLKQHQLNVRVC